jgi:hypothetical protein
MLELVRGRLGATDAHFEIGAKEPTRDDRCVAIALDDDVRLVARFDAAPEDPRGATQRLEELVRAFRDTAADARRRAEEVAVVPRGAAQDDLRQALTFLVDRSGAACAAVVDERSPIVWAAEPPGSFEGPEGGAFLQRARELQPDPSTAVHVASFGGIYRVALRFDDEPSPLRIEGALRAALPAIERAILSLPPVDPDSGGGGGKSVVRLVTD